MKKIKFRKKFKKPIFLALGMFDCVHLAHTHIIDILYKLSKERNCLAAVFTFSDISNSSFKKDKTIYTFSERTERFLERNLDAVIYARATKRFLQMPPEKFLDSILQRYNILGIACGEDYTFGRDALGDINMLKDFCLKKNIELKIVNTILDDGIKISTRSVKAFLVSGDIEKANSLLGSPYFIKGTVVKGAGRGGNFLFPTANITLDTKKFKILDGVYFTKTKVNDKTYSSLTNYGSRPSVDKKTNFIETHILDFSGNLYKQEIKVYFYKRIRDIKKFQSLEELKNQIEKDIKFVRSIKN